MSQAAKISSSDPTIAVAFGGGGARGYAHIHIIEVLDELGLQPVAISGASIGAIMGAGMASGMSGKEIRDYSLSMISDRTQLLARFWAARPSGLSDMFDGGLRLGQFNIQRVLRAFLPDRVPSSFEDLSIPTSIVATDFYGHGQALFDTGDLLSAIAASAAIPAVFQPVKRDGVYYIDGGIFNPVPYEHLFEKADIVIGIDVVGAPTGESSKPPSSVESLYGASQLMMQSLIQLKMQVKEPDVFVRPPVSDYRVMDFLKAKRILEDSAPVREVFKRKLDAAFAAHATL